MKNRALLALILLLPVALLLLFWLVPGTVKTPDTEGKKLSQDQAVARALAAAPQTSAIIRSNFAAPPESPYYAPAVKPAVVPAGAPAPLQVTNIPPQIVLENMSRAIRQYGSMFGGNPVGINSEITSQLLGQNPKHINFIQPGAGMRVNAAGELIDPWGTPYFFHQLSGHETEIRSAGPDRVMWTADDLVAE
jgi:hypothetical protein